MITVSLVAYQTDPEELNRILASIAGSSIDIVYVVDNSPTQALRPTVENYPSKARYIFNNKNLGYGKAHNIAINKATEEGARFHVIMNTDIFFKKEIIDELARYMESHPDVGLLAPKIFDSQGNLQYQCKLLPSPIDLIGRRFFPFIGNINNRNNRFELRYSKYNQIMNIPFLPGCFMFIRMDAVKEVGGFDEQMFMYCEDIDLSRRIHQKYKTIYYPLAEIVHVHKRESYKNRKMLWIHIRSSVYYFNKWGWFFDRERKKINNQVLNSVKFLD